MAKKIVYVDMDNTIVDFKSELKGFQRLILKNTKIDMMTTLIFLP